MRTAKRMTGKSASAMLVMATSVTVLATGTLVMATSVTLLATGTLARVRSVTARVRSVTARARSVTARARSVRVLVSSAPRVQATARLAMRAQAIGRLKARRAAGRTRVRRAAAFRGGKAVATQAAAKPGNPPLVPAARPSWLPPC
jgi:hypothetical protein